VPEAQFHPAVTIKPPFAERANSVTMRSISAASRTPKGVNSTPSEGAIAWIVTELADPGRRGGIAEDRRARHAGCNLFQHSS
jgi:hypothetical protein